MNGIKINIGCGRDYRDGWENIDISKEVKAEHYLDIRSKKLPFKNDTADEIYCSGVLEQILENEKFLFAINEMWRVLKVGGVLNIIVPNSKYSITFRDPFDCRHFLEETWNYLDKDHKHYQLYGSVYGFFGWKVKSVSTNQNGIMSVTLIKCE